MLLTLPPPFNCHGTVVNMGSRFFIVHPEDTGHRQLQRGSNYSGSTDTTYYGQGILPQIVHLQIECVFCCRCERVKKIEGPGMSGWFHLMMPGYWEYLKISCSGRFSYDSCCVTTRNHELDSKERFDLGKSLYVQVMQVTWLLVPCPSQQCCKVL